MIITLSGSNHFLLRQELNRLISEFTAKHGGINVEKLDGEEAELKQIIEAMQSLPFLAPSKLVVLRIPSAHKAFTEQFEVLAPTIPEGNQVIIVEPKLDKRLSYHKSLKKLTDFKEFGELDELGLKQWLVKYATSQKGSLNPAVSEHLISRIGTNQQLLASEIDKLISYDPQITKESIDLLTKPTPASTVFELLDAALSGNTKKALELYEQQRAQKVEPLAILAMIAWQLHALALVSTAGERTPDQVASETKLHPFVVRKTMGIAKRLPLARLKTLVAKALNIDVSLKTKSVDADEVLKNYLITLSK